VERDNEIRKEMGLPAPSLDELQLLLNAPEQTSKPWTDDDITLLLNRSKNERTELDEIKQYHKARYAGYVPLAWNCFPDNVPYCQSYTNYFLSTVGDSVSCYSRSSVEQSSITRHCCLLSLHLLLSS